MSDCDYRYRRTQMRPTFTRMVLILLACVCFSAVAFADTINVGIVGYDLLNPTGSSSGTTEFDIYNFTGANSLGADFPITTSLVLTNLTLTVKLSGGTEVFSLGSTSSGGSPSGPLFSTSDQKIGRASCRERVYISVVGVSLK